MILPKIIYKLCSFKPALRYFSTAAIYSIKNIWTRTFLKNIQNISQGCPSRTFFSMNCLIVVHLCCETIPLSHTVHITFLSADLCVASIPSKAFSQNVKMLGPISGCGRECPTRSAPVAARQCSQALAGQPRPDWNSMWNENVSFWMLSRGHTYAPLQTTLTVYNWLSELCTAITVATTQTTRGCQWEN